MLTFSLFFLLAINNVFSDCGIFSNTNITYIKSGYNGENFPAKYLDPDELPTRDDFVLFLNTLYRTVKYFNSQPNQTDINVFLGLFIMRGTLRRTLFEYGEKLEYPYNRMMLDVMDMAENVQSHFRYRNTQHKIDWTLPAHKLSSAIREDTVMANSMEDFHSGRLYKWLFTDFFINKYDKSMDEATLDRYNYSSILQTMGDNDFPSTTESNYCLAWLASIQEPQPDAPFQSCGKEPHCRRWLSTPPSSGYSLTHRLLEILLRHVHRRCYLESKEVDDAHMDLLCAAMYREAVYIARRGFFARDIFMEHVSFCGYRGHLEVHRVNWLRKIASWVDDQGCMVENHNLLRRRITVDQSLHPDDEEYKNRKRRKLKYMLGNTCVSHPMAVSMGTMATAVRYVLYNLHSSKEAIKTVYHV